MSRKKLEGNKKKREDRMQKVTAVVVTYNRIELLKECINSLQMQQSLVESAGDVQLDILIVDNASNDGTHEWIDGLTAEKEFHALHLSENTGGAGGFYSGMKWAVEHGADYVWIMDDDTIPEEDALAKLLDGMQEATTLQSESGKRIGFVSSSVLWTDGSECVMNRQHYVGDEILGNTEELTGSVKSENITLQPVDSATFVSLLFTREVILECGLPIKGYFIWGDDKEYTLRVSASYPCYHVKNSRVIHKMTNNAGSNIVIDDIKRVPRYFYAFRNDFCTAKRRGVKEVCIYFAAFTLNLMRVIFKSKDGKGLRIKTMWQGMRAGKRFAPEIEYVK